MKANAPQSSVSMSLSSLQLRNFLFAAVLELKLISPLSVCVCMAARYFNLI